MTADGRYAWVEGVLHAETREGRQAYARPCDWAAVCGPSLFLNLEPAQCTPAGQAAHAELVRAAFRPVRGMPDDFLVAWRPEGGALVVCALACGATTLTVRLEDLWFQLEPGRRATSYTCSVLRDPHEKDPPDADPVRETLTGLAPDVRMCLDVAARGGFILRFEPEGL